MVAIHSCFACVYAFEYHEGCADCLHSVLQGGTATHFKEAEKEIKEV